MTSIHHLAAEGFSAGAASYVAGRPDYPPELQEWLTQDLGLSEGEAAIGPRRTAQASFPLACLATGATVVAVEPVQEMLDQLIRQFPEIDARTGSAQHIPLDDDTMDAVLCAQSFHWFATSEALQEIHRVLKPGGFSWIWSGTSATKVFPGSPP